MTNIENFIQAEDTDISVAMITIIKDKYCFTLQPKNRWGKDKNQNDILYFGGIGGKVKPQETLLEALHREAKEEIGCSFNLLPTLTQETPLITKEQLEIKQIMATAKNPLPAFIFQNKRSENGRKSYTNVFVYKTELTEQDKMQPLDNPAIILIPKQTLYEMENGMPIATAQNKGVEIISQIPSPQNGILAPTPTPLALIKLHQNNITI